MGRQAGGQAWGQGCTKPRPPQAAASATLPAATGTLPSPHLTCRFVDGREGFGLSALHLAASAGHQAAVKSLLKWGASLTGKRNCVQKCSCNWELSVVVQANTKPWMPHSTPAMPPTVCPSPMPPCCVLHYCVALGRAYPWIPGWH